MNVLMHSEKRWMLSENNTKAPSGEVKPREALSASVDGIGCQLYS